MQCVTIFCFRGGTVAWLHCKTCQSENVDQKRSRSQNPYIYSMHLCTVVDLFVVWQIDSIWPNARNGVGNYGKQFNCFWLHFVHNQSLCHWSTGNCHILCVEIFPMFAQSTKNLQKYSTVEYVVINWCLYHTKSDILLNQTCQQAGLFSKTTKIYRIIDYVLHNFCEVG